MSERLSPVKLIVNTTKRKLSVNVTKCLICGKNAGHTARKPREKGTETFLKALIIRKECNGINIREYSLLADLEAYKWKDNNENNVRWHMNCYSSFVSPQNLGINKEDQKKAPNTRSSNPVINLKQKCMFCSFNKHKKDTILVQVQYDNVIKKIEEQCNLNDDKELRLKIGGDFSKLPAYEAKYHSGCYKNYMRVSKVKEKGVHDICFERLTVDIEETLLSGRAVEVNYFLDKFKEYLKENDYENFDSYTVQKLRQRIEKYYGSKVCFTNELNKKHSLYSSDIQIADAINVAFKYKQLLKDKDVLVHEQRNSESHILVRASEILKRDLIKVEGINIHPLKPEDINTTNDFIPNTLKEFLNTICNISNQQSIKISAIAQDIISLNSAGKKRMPKNIALGMSLKNSLRSKEFINYLYSLGHSISYDDILRIETTWADDILSKGEGYATIPSNIKCNFFTQSASDNGDYAQENGSQHVTNTVLYQYQIPLQGNFQSIETRRVTRKLTHRRSIALIPEPMMNFEEIRKPDLPSYYSECLIADVYKDECSKARKFSSSLNTAWTLLRITGNKIFQINVEQCVPQWTEFRKLVSLKISTPTLIGNCRSLPHSPTDINVVYTMLMTVKKMLVNINQKDPCVTLDESIYQMAKEIQWAVPYLQDLTVRLGGFHRAKNFMGDIGKRMKSSGFKELLESSQLFGSTQIEGILNIGNYNRAVTSHKTMVDALSRLHWDSLLKWLKNEDYEWRVETLDESLRDSYCLFRRMVDIGEEPEQLKAKMEELTSNIIDLEPLISCFNQIGKSSSDTFAFWLEYCEMVNLLLDFLAAERNADWLLHLETFKAMLKYDHAFDHYKYFNWGTIYIIDMLRLPTEHPELYQMFLQGCHIVSRSNHEDKFNCVSTDMALEQSMNRDSKTKGGIIGISNNDEAVEKWTLTSHLRADVKKQFKQLCGQNSKNNGVVISKKKNEKGEIAVRNICETVKEKFINPFDIKGQGKQELINIATGHIVNKEFVDEILNAASIGEAKANEFMNCRLIEKSVSFWDSVKRMNLKTFSSTNKTMKVSRKDEGTITLKYQQNVFSRLLSVSGSRNIDLKTILSYELAPVPLSLFYLSGEMRKTNKSDLLHKLEALATSKSYLNNDNFQSSATVIDFMSIVQSANVVGILCFGDLADRIEKNIFNSFKESKIIAIVPDRYDDDVISLKSAERNRRGNNTTPAFAICNDNQKLPTGFQQFLKNSKNKSNLITYLFDKWIDSFPQKLDDSQVIYFAKPNGTTIRIQQTSNEQLEWHCDHDEADSKMFVYCKLLTEYNLSRIVVVSPDTDVLVLCCYHYICCLNNLPELWFKTGVSSKKRYIPVHQITSTLGNEVTKMMPAFHAITGCDSVSSFSGIGKKTAFETMQTKVEVLSDLFEFGEKPDLDTESASTEAAIKMVCLLYDKANNFNTNNLRYKLFIQKNKYAEKLPPTLDALVLHLRRATFQTYIWRNACKNVLQLPSPVENGWKIEDGSITPEHMLLSPLPENAIEFIRCKCKKQCKTNICSCKRSNLACTEACLCNEDNECLNTFNNVSSEDEDSD